jgi:hypothetical protein
VRSFFGWGFLLQIAALIHWAKRRPDTFWLWIIIIGGPIGSIAYFVVEGDFTGVRNSFKAPSRRRRIALLRAIVRDNPAAGNYEELGELLLEQKKWAEARDAFDHALAQRTDSLHTFYFRGVAEFELGDNEAAIRDLEHVVKIDPKHDYSRAMCLLGQAYARTRRTAEATALFDKLVASSTAPESLTAAAEFYVEQGRAAEAKEIVESILARRPTMPAYQRRRDAKWLRKARQLARRSQQSARAATPR